MASDIDGQALRALCPLRPQTKASAADLDEVMQMLAESVPPDAPEPLPLPHRGRLALPDHAPRLIAPTGYPQSGKDVIADYLQLTYAGVERMAFSDVIIIEANAWFASTPVLAAAGQRIHLGNKSDPVYRRLLQAWGIIRREEDEYWWVKRLRERVQQLQEDPATRLVVLTGARAQSDVDLVRELHGQVWRIIRPSNPYKADSPIERGLDHLKPSYYDHVIYNDREGDFAHYLRKVEYGIASPDLRFFRRLKTSQRIAAAVPILANL